MRMSVCIVGGLKVWECSIDLVEYLSNYKDCLTGLRVLELGCGAGLPGIWAYKHGADHVTFQDYVSLYTRNKCTKELSCKF